MLFEDMAEAIGRARGAALDDITRALWGAVASGQISDEQAGRLSQAVDTRRAIFQPRPAPGPVSLASVSIFRPRRAQRTPDRVASTIRRRTLAASGPMPCRLAASFTTAELAVLHIIADEVRDAGLCDRSLAEIAARAGCSRTTAQTAIRTARTLGLLTVEVRPRQGKTNLPNVVTIVSGEWLAWITRGTRRADPTGFKSAAPTERQGKRKGIRGVEGRPASPSNTYRQGQHQPPNAHEARLTAS